MVKYYIGLCNGVIAISKGGRKEMSRRLSGKFTMVFLLVGLMALLLSACSARSTEDSAVANNAAYSDHVYEQTFGSRAGSVELAATGSKVEDFRETRYLILTGSMDLIVTDTPEITQEVKKIAENAGGIVSASYLYEVREGHRAAQVTLRVPADRFNVVMEQLQGLGKDTGVRFNENDVTMEYVDLEARLKNLNAQEERLREILDMAATVEEVLTVEKELGRVRGEIESMTAQFNYLQDQVLLSTIYLNIREEAIATQAISPAPFENLGERMKEAFVRSINLALNGLAGLVVAFTAMLPLLFILGLVVALLWLVIAKVRRRPPAA